MRIHAARLLGTLVLCMGAPALTAAQSPSSGTSIANHADAAIGVRLSTLGLQVEAGKLLTSHVAARVDASFFKVSTSKSQSDITFDATAKGNSIALLLDLSPKSRGAFHFTGGLVTKPLSFNGNGQPTGGTFDVNNHTYNASQVGTLTAKAAYPSLNPYVGLGFGTPSRARGAIEFLFDLGIAIGTPKLTLSATGAASNPQLAADLQAERDKDQKDIEKYAKVYPVISLGFGFRF